LELICFSDFVTSNTLILTITISVTYLGFGRWDLGVDHFCNMLMTHVVCLRVNCRSDVNMRGL